MAWPWILVIEHHCYCFCLRLAYCCSSYINAIFTVHVAKYCVRMCVCVHGNAYSGCATWLWMRTCQAQVENPCTGCEWVVDNTCHRLIIAGKLVSASVHVADCHQGISPYSIDNRLRRLFLVRLALVQRSNYAQKLKYDANTTKSKTG